MQRLRVRSYSYGFFDSASINSSFMDYNIITFERYCGVFEVRMYAVNKWAYVFNTDGKTWW